VHKAERRIDFDEACVLFREYGESLDADHGFQGFEEGIAAVPGKYMSPKSTLRNAKVRATAGSLPRWMPAHPW
jgi:hypothetical protein